MGVSPKNPKSYHSNTSLPLQRRENLSTHSDQTYKNPYYRLYKHQLEAHSPTSRYLSSQEQSLNRDLKECKFRPVINSMSHKLAKRIQGQQHYAKFNSLYDDFKQRQRRELAVQRNVF